jgi:hypothetical protein
MHFSAGSLKESFDDINEAMDQADSESPLYYYVRAVIFISMGRH